MTRRRRTLGLATRRAPRRAGARVPRVAARLALPGLLLALPGLLLAAPPGPQPPPVSVPRQARPAPVDSTLEDYLRSLADTTDRYFGRASAPVDTAGLDSSLALWLDRLPPARPRRSLAFSPWLSFHRADGLLWGGATGWGLPEAPAGELSGRLGRAVGAAAGRGGAAYRKRWSGPGRREERSWTIRAEAGRFTAVLDPERRPSFLRTLRALVNGDDRQHYLLREGLRVAVERETPTWRAGVAVRGALESRLPTTTTWNLLGRPLAVEANHPAERGQARELELLGAVRAPALPIQVEGSWRGAGHALGGDFDYRRWRLALGGDFPVGTVASLVPQATYGRITGDLPPQAGFYLGGTRSLLSFETGALGGAAEGFGKLDLIFAPDLLRLARIPHPEAFPIQGALFAAAGAVWGRDPYGGTARPGESWPERREWRSEIGASLLYRPGIPDPAGFLRLDYAWPLGPDGGDPRFTIDYSIPLDQLRPLP